jgi:hypothetical protein
MRIRQLACESGDAGKLTAYNIGGEPRYTRSLYTTRSFKGQTRAGLVSIPLGPAVLNAVNRVLHWPTQNHLRRDEAIGARIGSEYYSLHKLYKSGTGLLSEEAIVLHAASGQILAHQRLKDIDTDQPCDGCSFLNYSDEVGMYIPMNMFELPGFRSPLLLLNTSTSEGQALSLLTFTPDGQLDSFRVYEYVVRCG